MIKDKKLKMNNLATLTDFSDISAYLIKTVPEYVDAVEKFNNLANENSLDVNVTTKASIHLNIRVRPSENTNLSGEQLTELGHKVEALKIQIEKQHPTLVSKFSHARTFELNFEANNPNYKSELEELRKSFQASQSSLNS